ncbi:hypothetical protein GLAREA_06966 [Glarea lozoyensis ATCC 20868]|uniref:Rhodopsin domain-containing protein n=1 Tax=Glarea lozoyensis (strain ATCC 20868 / MF5171) TaxID=1116229 RepID=S3E6F2_GLAL2|nr:uncharacterized protein GLAREA_06966 [Glarea lozoyensis ATCC 20868]EPE33953.1 hypothetical protein GLAREA_06966 [Glarea lozoyensis ATCC 20868]
MALSADTVQTLAFLWVFTWLAMFLMALRIVMRRYRGQKLDISDRITMVCMICLLARLSFIHVVLIWGTNNIPKKVRAKLVFTATDIYQRETASKLLLTSRTWYNTYLWLQKAVIMILYQRLLAGFRYTNIIIRLYWVILGVSYLVIQIVTFTDCHPLKLYWQVVPDPGVCSQAVGQLITLGSLNIFTDVILIILPMPALLKVKRTGGDKFRLIFLFSLGVFLVIITVIRLPLNIKDSNLQVNRTTWASVEAFTAAFVANVPTLYTLRKKLPTKVFGTDDGDEFPSGWTESVHSIDMPSPAIYKPKFTNYNTAFEDHRNTMTIPPPVPPKDPLPVPKPEEMIKRSSIPIHFQKPSDRHARIHHGKMVVVEEESGEMIDWDEVASMDLEIIIDRFHEGV